MEDSTELHLYVMRMRSCSICRRVTCSVAVHILALSIESKVSGRRLSPVSEMSFHIKIMAMSDAQRVDHCNSIPSSQTFILMTLS
jgi:hypothetical protein